MGSKIPSDDNNANKQIIDLATVEVVSSDSREKMKRHDRQHDIDMKLASELQSHWAARVEAEHRAN